MKNFRGIYLTAAWAAALSVTGVVSCTKTIPYKQLYKDKVENKADVSTSDEYLYVPTTSQTNESFNDVSHAMPYWQADSKIVKFRFTETSLQAVQVDDDTRLKDNQTNEKILIDIPITHVDYQCTQDHYKKCTNQEEENRDIGWQNKTKFSPDFDKMKTVGVSLLPLEMDQVYGGSCFTEVNAQFMNYQLTPDALNIEVQKTFRGDISCLSKKGIILTNLDDLQTQMVYHYSFTRLKNLASANYKPVDYPDSDESTFGFFKSTIQNSDIDYNQTEATKLQYLKRWSPDKQEIVYYMTDNFNKPEFKAIKRATQEAFAKVNNGLQAAGLKTRLTIKDPAQKNPGDMRNNMIILVEDPIAAGPLGYGPTAENPRTGEIVSARVALYYGNYLQNIKYSYDEVVRDMQKEKNAGVDLEKNPPVTMQKKPDQAPAQPAGNAQNLSPNLQYQMKLKEYMFQKHASAIGQKIANNYMAAKALAAGSSTSHNVAAKIAVSPWKGMSARQFAKATLQVNKQYTAKDALSAMSKYCNYPAELFPFNEIVRNALQSRLGKNLRYWNDLSSDERQAVLDIILPQAWEPTLVHELGHNLGLRHNFGGSEDKDNFYTKDELARMNVHHEIPYSSVMDYGYSELNLLPTLGKYDIAALRFGYKREVDTNDGKTLSVNTTLQALRKTLPADDGKKSLKDYKYCTDEHVDVNPNCKRFDKGSTYSEIADYLIQSYNDMYKTRSFRNGRESFSKYSDGAVYEARKAQFEYIRAFMDRYKDLKVKFRIADDDPAWTQEPVLKDIKAAALKSGQFFMNLIKTPDVLCMVAQKSDPAHAVEIVPLAALTAGTDGFDCFRHAHLKSDYIVIGQTGRSFNDIKDPESTNVYADQIDVRGIWVDKIAAAEMLFKRRIGNDLYDVSEDNYSDIKELSKDVATTLASMLLNQVENDVTFVDAAGNKISKLHMNYNVFSDPDSMKSLPPTHWINPPIAQEIADQVGVPMQQVSYQQVLLNLVNDAMKSSQSHWKEDEAFMSGFRVVKTLKAYQLSDDADVTTANLGATRLVAMPQNQLAGESMNVLNINNLLGKLSPAQMQTLFNERTQADQAAKAAGATATAGAQQAADPNAAAAATAATQPTDSQFSKDYQQIPLEYIQAYAAGVLPSTGLVEYLLSILPSANPPQ